MSERVPPPTEDQALIIAEVAATADGGCICCARDLADGFAARWPEWPWRKLIDEAGGWDGYDE